MKIRNWSILITFSALACFFYFYITPQYLHPAEDATILFSYAQNLADTGKISYYPGGPIVDGSTDFLFLIATAGVIKLGYSAYTAALMVSAFAMMALMFFIYRLLDTRFISTQYLVLGLIFFSQQIWASVLGYGTMLFAMSLAYLALTYWKGRFFHFCLACCFAILCRPDAIITIVPLMLHKLYADKLPFGRKFWQLSLFFLLPMGLYVFWRHHYFGQVLPLSFDINTTNGKEKIFGLIIQYSFHYVKGYAIYYIWPGLLGLLLYLTKEKFKVEPGYYVLIISMIVLPMLAYMCVRENLDFSRRYFIAPYLGLVILIGLMIRNKKSIIISLFGLILLVRVGINSFDQGIQSLSHYYYTNYTISEDIGKLPKGTIATSEAGLMAWKTGFKTIDLWGLNTPQYTHRLPSVEDIQAINADLIVLHAGKTEYQLVSRDSLSNQKNWVQLARRTVIAMHESKYEIYEVPYDKRAFSKPQPSSQGLLKAFFQWLSERNPRPITTRTDLYAIQPDSPLAPELRKILEKQGGKIFVSRN